MAAPALAALAPALKKMGAKMAINAATKGGGENGSGKKGGLFLVVALSLLFSPVLVAAILFTPIIAAVVAGSAGGNAQTTCDSPAMVSGPVWAVGDQVMVAATPALKTRLPGIVIDAAAGRTP